MKTRHPLTRELRRFAGAAEGVSAVEFGLIAPVLILMLLGSFETSRAVTLKSKVSLLAATISDFLSQKDKVGASEIAEIVAASTPVLYPYSSASSVLTVHVESIVKKNNAFVTDWSYSSNKSPKTSTTDTPSTYTPTQPTVIRTVITYQYVPTFTSFMGLNFSTISLQSEAVFVPRNVDGDAVEAGTF